MKGLTIFKVFVILFFISLMCMLYGYLIERRHIKVEHVTLTSDKFPPDFAGMRLVQISDLHMNVLTDYEREIAKQVNALQPDVIVITGDFFKQRDDFEGDNARTKLPATIKEIRAFLALLTAPHGVYICRGNNDFSNDKEVSDIFLDSIMNEKHVTILVNAGSTIDINGQRLHLLGVDYPGFSRWDVNEFKVTGEDSNNYLTSWFSFKNSYSHVLLGDARELWQNYTYTGRFRQTDPDAGGLGITFYSQFDLGYDRFYRLRRLAGWSKFVLSPHGVKTPTGITSFDFDMPKNEWVHFKIRCFMTGDGNRMQVRLWRENEPEPDIWFADAVDTTAQFSNGTIGLWSHGKDWHHFDDLCVTDSAGDTLFFDDFEDGGSLGWVDFNFEGKAVPWLKQSIPDSEYTILLAHAPDIAPWADTAGVDLQLSGHTHGGQVRLPLIGPVVVGTKMGRKYAEGLFQFDNTWLYVNRGLGTVLLPLRFLCRPEITLIAIKSDAD